MSALTDDQKQVLGTFGHDGRPDQFTESLYATVAALLAAARAEGAEKARAEVRERVEAVIAEEVERVRNKGGGMALLTIDDVRAALKENHATEH